MIQSCNQQDKNVKLDTIRKKNKMTTIKQFCSLGVRGLNTFQKLNQHDNRINVEPNESAIVDIDIKIIIFIVVLIVICLYLRRRLFQDAKLYRQ